MTTTAIIDTEEAMIMTDPTWLPHEIDTIRRFIDKNIGNRQLYIIYTHSDFDHIIGAGAFPEATVIASKQFDNHPNKEEVLQKVYDFDQAFYLSRNYIPVYPSVDVVVSNNGQTLTLGTVTLTFYHAPGHTNDSLFTVVEPYGIFLAGDYLSDVEFPFIFSSYQDYVHTITTAERLLLTHSIDVLVPGHGSTTQLHDEIKERIAYSKQYLEELPRTQQSIEHALHKKYSFYDGMKSIHVENIKIAKKEKE